MYNKLLKRKTLYKIFILIMPKKKKNTISSYYLCKYFIKTTPYGKFSIFLSEINKIMNIFLINLKIFKLLFVCSHKIFFLKKKNKKLIFLNIKKDLMFNYKQNFKILSFIFLYNINYSSKFISFFKDQKFPLIGFIDFHHQPNLIDYTILLESRFFSSIYFFHFLLKKYLYNVKN